MGFGGVNDWMSSEERMGEGEREEVRVGKLMGDERVDLGGKGEEGGGLVLGVVNVT